MYIYIFVYNAGTWPVLSEKEAKSLEISRARPYRTMQGLELKPDAPLVSSGRVLQCARDRSTAVCISLARLRYMPRFHRSAPALLRALVWATAAETGSWISALDEDLQWLRELVGSACREARSCNSTSSWMVFAAESKQRWKTLLKNAIAEEARRRELTVYNAYSPVVLVPDQVHVCGECAAEFNTRAALNTHFGRKHLLNVARLYAEGPICRGCLVAFTSRDHVVHHLAVTKRRCLGLLMASCPPMTDEQEVELQQDDCSRRRAARAAGMDPRCANLPAHRVPGPLRRATHMPRTPPGTPPSSSASD